MNLVSLISFLGLLLSVSGCGTTTSASFSLRGSYTSVSTESLQIVTSGSPKSMAIEVFALYLGTKADCTDLKVVQDYGIGSQGYDLYKNPLLFSANPANNTYRCVAIRLKDIVTVRMNNIALSSWPDVCLEDVDYDKDLYLASTTETWKDANGTPITATGTEKVAGANTITLFGSTQATQATSGTLGLAPSQVFTLSKEITLPYLLTFYIDYTNGINGQGTCKLSTGSIGMR